MKYKVLYNTQINNEFKAKDEVIEFPQGTDESYILSLVRNKVIEETQEEVQDEVEKVEETQEGKVNQGKKASKSRK